jgi:hypothetical protein
MIELYLHLEFFVNVFELFDSKKQCQITSYPIGNDKLKQLINISKMYFM